MWRFALLRVAPAAALESAEAGGLHGDACGVLRAGGTRLLRRCARGVRLGSLVRHVGGHIAASGRVSSRKAVGAAAAAAAGTRPNATA